MLFPVSDESDRSLVTEQRDDEGFTPLHYALSHDQFQSTMWAISNGKLLIQDRPEFKLTESYLSNKEETESDNRLVLGSPLNDAQSNNHTRRGSSRRSGR